MRPIYYRIVEDDFAEDEGNPWMIDVVIQTEDPEDFEDFDEAIGECLDRIQERIDREEDLETPAEDYLDKLREMLGDSTVEDWDEYVLSVSQPKTHYNGQFINLASVSGRDQIRLLLEQGISLDERDIDLLERLNGQSKVGAGVPKVKPKRLKARRPPSLTFQKVRLDPEIATRFSPEFIEGFLNEHRRILQDRESWKQHHDGFLTDISSPEAFDGVIRTLTVFFDELTEDSPGITFAVLVPPGEARPDDDEVMDRATVEYVMREKPCPDRDEPAVSHIVTDWDHN